MRNITGKRPKGTERQQVKARDRAAKEHWLEGERCWITLANQAELVAALNAFSKT
jgi:hypothetical protein